MLGRNERNGGRVQSGTSYVDPAASCGATNGTAVVGSYAPSDWGLYDMHGNVYEWCLDWYADDITGIDGKVNIDPATPANTLSGTPAVGSARVKRGGGWSSLAGDCRPAFRSSGSTGNQLNYNGLRVICTAGLR